MKSYLTVPLELKALNDRELEGHGSVFGNLDLGGDIVEPGAFKASLDDWAERGALPQMFWMHQPDKVPGKWVEMYEDDKGLYVRGVLADTELGREMRVLAQMKAVRGLSIGYQPNRAVFDRNGNQRLKEVNLWEVSLVSLAMNPLAEIESMKAARISRDGEFVPTARELEGRLRDAGFSRKVACAMTAKILDGHSGKLIDPLRDAGEEVDGESEVLAALRCDTDSLERAVLSTLLKG